jgi:hypothetical protein
MPDHGSEQPNRLNAWLLIGGGTLFAVLSAFGLWSNYPYEYGTGPTYHPLMGDGVDSKPIGYVVFMLMGLVFVVSGIIEWRKKQ